MREPPPEVDDRDLVELLRLHWDDRVADVAYLPWGFGAHHWSALTEEGERLFFVTLDSLEPQRTAARLEAAYAGAAALAESGLEFVVPTVPSRDRTLTRPWAGGAVSCTPWLDGTVEDDLDVPWTRDALTRLHTAEPPAGLPPWVPVVGPELADELSQLSSRDWGPGPYATTARDAVRRHLGDLERWTARYHHLADAARSRAWVATHGRARRAQPAAHRLRPRPGRLGVVEAGAGRARPPHPCGRRRPGDCRYGDA